MSKNEREKDAEEYCIGKVRLLLGEKWDNFNEYQKKSWLKDMLFLRYLERIYIMNILEITSSLCLTKPL